MTLAERESIVTAVAGDLVAWSQIRRQIAAAGSEGIPPEMQGRFLEIDQRLLTAAELLQEYPIERRGR